MGRLKIPRELSVIGLSFGLGCGGGGGGGGGSISNQLDNEIQKGWNILCACFANFGFDSQQECLADLDDEPDEYEMCIRDVYDNSTEDDPNQQCILNAVRQMNTCIGQLTCDEINFDYESGFYECYMDYYRAVDNCPELPESFEMMLEECYDYGTTAATFGTSAEEEGGGQFECEDGSGSIPQEWVCDGDEDCDDASDEAECSSLPDSGSKRFKRPKLQLYSAG